MLRKKRIRKNNKQSASPVSLLEAVDIVIKEKRKRTAKTPLYHTKNPAEMAKFAAKIKPVEFIQDGSEIQYEFILAPINLLPNDFGVYAADNIKMNSFVGEYKGEYLEDINEDHEDSRYVFDHDKGGVIDALNKRNWTAYINHSCIPNVVAMHGSGFNGEKEIHLYALRDIAINEPIYLDYGPKYFTNLGFTPYFLGPNDDWKTPLDMWHAHRASYAEQAWKIDATLAESLGLPDAGSYLLPLLCKAVLENDVDSALSLLNDREQTSDLLLLAVDQEKGLIREASQQEKVTALMLAFHLGDNRMINVFLDHYIKVANQANFTLFRDQSWKSGKSPLAYLLQGLATKEVKLSALTRVVETRQKLEKKYNINDYFQLVDAKNNNILSYCIDGEMPECSALLLNTKAIASGLFKDRDTMVANIMKCVTKGDLATLELIFQSKRCKSIFNKIKSKEIYMVFCRSDYQKVLTLLKKYEIDEDVNVIPDYQLFSQSKNLLWQERPKSPEIEVQVSVDSESELPVLDLANTQFTRDYLGLLGIKRQKPSLAYLNELITRHLIVVPYNNYAMLNWDSSYCLERLAPRKALDTMLAREGCNQYILHSAFKQLLLNLGFNVIMPKARTGELNIGLFGSFRGASEHTMSESVLLVTLDDEYMVDLAKGVHIRAALKPIKNNNLALAKEDEYRLKKVDNLYKLQVMRHGNWENVYNFVKMDTNIEDFYIHVVYFCADHFIKKSLILFKCNADGGCESINHQFNYANGTLWLHHQSPDKKSTWLAIRDVKMAIQKLMEFNLSREEARSVVQHFDFGLRRRVAGLLPYLQKGK